MSAESELRPCPFCGHVRVRVSQALREGYQAWAHDPDAYAYSVVCTGCAAEGGWAKSESGARQRWNMRTAPEGSGE